MIVEILSFRIPYKVTQSSLEHLSDTNFFFGVEDFKSSLCLKVEYVKMSKYLSISKKKFFLMDTMGETLLKPALARKAVKHCKKTRDKYLVQLDE